MNRRSFLKFVGAILLAPFVGKGTPKGKSTFAEDVQGMTGYPYVLKNTRWHKSDELYAGTVCGGIGVFDIPLFPKDVENTLSEKQVLLKKLESMDCPVEIFVENSCGDRRILYTNNKKPRT